ncbi:lipopolysaccharide biosynthesis protein [Fusobacterium perfoetens]|uniref:lipopolysaccharide biosynthesis protein n=1 Tax=Fusobacterium perfoetens TaxID=852 RepID=UPI001F257820|nr:oligosaccharide flippase family protein [Fusobacterium perfoetens]MCF2613236.1 oligosaccharide flippase family protein [Fusobacterium perfoetens]
MKKEVLINFILTVLSNAVLFIQNRYFVQYMGLETLGIMKLFTQLLAYLNIIEMGLGSASAFALYKPLAEKDYKNISIVINTIDNIYNKIAVLLIILGALCIPIIPFFTKVSNFSNEIYFYWVLYVLNTVSTYLFIKYVILFTANQEFLYVRSVQSISKSLFQLLQIICIIKYHSFFIYIILLILDNLVQWVFFRFHYKKKYSFIIKTKEKFNGIKNDIKNLFWHKIGGLVVFNTDLILISKFTSLEIVGIYASYQMIVQTLKTIIDILTNVLSPKIGNFIAKHNKIEIYESLKKFNIFYCFIATVFTYCMYVLINSFVNLWLVETILLSNFTIELICFNLWVNLFRGILDKFKEGAGFFDDIKSPILESVINLVVSIILGLKLGLDGVIIGTIVSNITVILIYKPILVFERCFNKDWKEYIKVYGNYLILVIISLISLNFITKPFIQENITSWLSWIVYAVKISSISLIAITLIFLLNKNFRNLLKENIKIKKEHNKKVN